MSSPYRKCLTEKSISSARGGACVCVTWVCRHARDTMSNESIVGTICTILVLGALKNDHLFGIPNLRTILMVVLLIILRVKPTPIPALI